MHSAPHYTMLTTIMLNISLIEWLYISILLVYLCTVFSIIWVVISENRNPVRSLAWITVLLMVPVFGIVLYAFFGRSLKSKIMLKQRLRRLGAQEMSAIEVKNANVEPLASTLQIIHLAENMCRSYYSKGNKVEIFTDGATKFDVLKRDLMQARCYINMQYYIFEDDEIGREIKDILIRKAREGVKVRVIYDDVGSFKVKRRFFAEMRRGGVLAFPFMRITFPQFAQRVNWRNHRKILIIDGRYGYIGGMNIADRYIKGCSWGDLGVWRDTHLRITGPAIESLQRSFAFDWNFMNKGMLNDPIEHFSDMPGDAGVQLVSSGPTSEWNNIALMMLQAIGSAKRCIYLQTPYFLPTEALLKALQTAALSGVDVRLMMPRQSDSAMLRHASYSYVTECLKAGIKVYLYTAGMLHSKVLIVDDDLSSVGSTNFDFRSFEHNYEANVFIYSADTNARLKQIFHDDIKHSMQCDISQWLARPTAQRMVDSLVRLFSPIL